jgi:adenine deaminase
VAVQPAVTPPELLHAIDCAAGRRPGSLLLANAVNVNVYTGELLQGNVLLAGRLIAAVGPGVTGAERMINLDGRFVTPGLIDAHLHLESTLALPREIARVLVPRGVTGLVCDPHEIANVLGLHGIRYLMAAAAGLPLDVWFAAPSCVPATDLETAGARLGLAEIEELLRDPRVVATGELMNYPAIIGGTEAEVLKAYAAEVLGKPSDGHAPGVTGRALHAYAAAGVSSDHESSTLEEALEKVRAGIQVLIRDASVARNLEALLPAVTAANYTRFSFCTDDKLPHDLLDEGGVDAAVRKAIRRGISPPAAIAMASLNTARHYRLPRRGAVAPGCLADIAVFDDLGDLHAHLVLKEGRPVASEGVLTADLPAHDDPSVRHTVRLPALDAGSLRLPEPARGRVIGLIPGEILTREVIVERPGVDPGRDLAKLAVINRHGNGGGIGLGLVQGFGLQRGAIASTVAHDSHNLVVAGTDDGDMLLAARHLQQVGGGFAAVAGGRLLADLPLPIAGLVSDRSLPEIRRSLDRLHAATRGLGVSGESPYMTLSFLPLPVIPELKLTDRGLVRISPAGLEPVSLAV